MKNLFSKSLTQKNQLWVIENYSGNEWFMFLKMFGNKKITNDSCNLARKIYQNVNRKIFPVIFSRKLCHAYLAQGMFSWIMYDCNILETGCTDNVKECLNSNTHFTQENRYDRTELYLCENT